jgi:hypothetical protein
MVLQKIAVLLLALVYINANAQCYYTHITSLPYTETFCHEHGDCNFVQNSYPISNLVFGCWTCLNNPHYYVITPEVDTYVVLDIYPDLFSHLASNTEPQVPGFILFDGCPNNGGETLFRPWTYSSGACWDWGVLDVYCGWSQSTNAPNLNQGCVTSTPAYTGMAHEVTMGFELEAGEEYWFCIFPQGGCPPWTNTCNWGCIDVSFSGITFLEIDNTPVTPVSTPPQELSTPPRFQKLHIPNRGIVIKDTHTGHTYNMLMQIID